MVGYAMSTSDSANDESQPEGDCFVAAFNTLFDMMDDPELSELVLVHGNVPRLPQVDSVNHAWVENASTVFDYSNRFQTQMAKDAYYSQLQIFATRRYTPMEALRENAQYNHYGPWPQ